MKKFTIMLLMLVTLGAVVPQAQAWRGGRGWRRGYGFGGPRVSFGFGLGSPYYDGYYGGGGPFFGINI